jgi:hypothetical protein
MGQQLCACFEDPEDAPEPEGKLTYLKVGGKFARSIYLGLSSQELHMQLTEDTGSVSWRVVGSSSEEFGEIDLTLIKTLRSKGKQGLEFVNNESKVIFEVQADDTAQRDQWIVGINELLAFWAESPAKKPSVATSAKGTSNKAEYFKQKEAELKAKEADAAERKKKYGNVGMKYTAIAMASRP